MTEVKYDPESPFAVTTKKYPEGTSYVIARFNNEQDAVDWAESPFPGGHEDGTAVIDTTPKPKIPEDAEFIMWRPDANSALEFAESTQGFWAWGADEVSVAELVSEIGDAEVTVLVRKEDA